MKIAVIGGGASGMMAAITAADNGAQVTLFEGNDRVGKKILATGNGKCNFSNKSLSRECYYGQDTKKAFSILQRFDTASTIAFFEKAGMMVKDRQGYLYPASGQAATVLDILRMQLKEKKVQVLTESRVKGIRQEKNGCFTVDTGSNKAVFDKVIVSCGSKAAPKTGSDGNGYGLTQSIGHSLIPVVPALTQLKCEENLKAVSGVRVDAKVTLVTTKARYEEQGELQLTDYGISGIVVFQLSRLAAYELLEKKNPKVYIDCLPQLTEKEYASFIRQRKNERARSETVEDFFTGMLNKKLMLYFMKLAGLKPTDSYSVAPEKKIDKVFSLCKNFTLTVNGCNSYDSAQVCAGGVPLREVTDELESLYAKGLFLTGELLDVDGKCGGYNLQWAWASGYIAGRAAAGKKVEE